MKFKVLRMNSQAEKGSRIESDGRIYKLGEGKVLEILSTDYTDWTDFFEEKIRKSA